MSEEMNEVSERKTVLMLDMWAEAGAKAGASKKWLHAELEKEYRTAIVNAGTTRGDKIRCLVDSFALGRKRWGRRYHELQEKIGKTPALFRKRSRRFQRAFGGLPSAPDAVLQIGALFGPLSLPGIPYLSYHDQTVKMVEEGWPRWLPDDFQRFSDEWYALEREVYHSVDRVVTYSECTRRSMISDYGVPADKVLVIPAACKMAPARAEELKAARKRQLIVVSTDFRRKGVDLVLAAFPLIKKAHPEVTLLIAGGKVPAGVTIDDPAITHVGNVPQQVLRRLLLQSSLLVHPARYDAFPNVLKEAMACGLPSVASRRCGMDEIIVDGETGTLIDELVPPALAAAVIELLADRERLECYGKAGLSRSPRFATDRIGIEFRRLISGLL